MSRFASHAFRQSLVLTLSAAFASYSAASGSTKPRHQSPLMTLRLPSAIARSGVVTLTDQGAGKRFRLHERTQAAMAATAFHCATALRR
jgi:hypothetical protein